MSQIDLLQKLKRKEITAKEFLDASEDPSLDKYKLTKEEFLKDTRISEETKQHELKHASVYEAEGMVPEFYYINKANVKAATSATKESLNKWIENKSSDDFLELLKRVVSAPQEMGDTDKKNFEVLNS